MSEQKVVFTKDAPFRKSSSHHNSQLLPIPLRAAANNPPAAGPYSQAVGTSSTIYCSGQVPLNAAGEMVKGSISEMTEQCIKNLEAVLKAAGSSIEKVVKVNVFLTTMDNFKEMNGTYEKFFTHKPARSCVAVYQLPLGVPIEIECIALA